jgi:hypothetical protein
MPRALVRNFTYLVGCFVLFVVTSVRADLPEFEPQVIDDAVCEVACYAVAVADVDEDGLEDIVAVNERQVHWYKNPDWTKHVIIEDQTERDNVCIAPHDIDGDGHIDFALGAGWTMIGTIQWLSRGDSLDEPWNVHFIGEEPWTHRMRFANVLGLDQPQLVVSPLNATQGEGVRLLAFTIPDNPREDRWPMTVMDDGLNRMHNHWHVDVNEDGVLETLTASQEGLHVVGYNMEQQSFYRHQGSPGLEGGSPEASGAGEIKTGQLADGAPIVATIEPMHGHSVVVYTIEHSPNSPEHTLQRHVLDESLNQGHAVWLTDLNGGPGDEVIAGHREPGTGEIAGPGIYIYEAEDDEGTSWTKHVLDNGGIAVEDLICSDLDEDGDMDIIAGGRSTRNLKVYWNGRE